MLLAKLSSGVGEMQQNLRCSVSRRLNCLQRQHTQAAQVTDTAVTLTSSQCSVSDLPLAVKQPIFVREQICTLDITPGYDINSS
jgi:hypothetical protein